MAITYVGGQTAGRAGAASTTNVTYALTGGSNSTPQAGDLVVITMVVGSQARNPAQAVTAPATFTSLGQLNPNTQTYDTSMNVSYKFMGGTPDTTFTAPSTGNVADAQRWTVQVFRGVDPTTPLDVAAVAASAVGTSRCNPGSITPTTTGAWVVICGGGAAATGAAYTAPANYTTNFLTGFTADTNDALVGSGYRAWTSGAEDPAVYTGGSTATTSSWAAYTIALRPASNVTLALTGAQVAAQAGTLTKSNTGNVTLTGAQVAASAGSVTASQANPNTPIVISSTTIALGTSATPGAQSITVPSDAQLVVVQATTYGAGGLTLSLASSFAGTFTTTTSGDGSDKCHIAYALISGTGSQTITPTWSGAVTDGPVFVVSFVKGINTGDFLREARAYNWNIQGSTGSTSIATGLNDLLLVLDRQATTPAPNAMSGYTSITTQVNNNIGGRVQTCNAPGTSSTTVTTVGTEFPGLSMISIKSGAGGDISLALTGAQATASAGTLTASQQVAKALTGEQVSALAGTVGKQVSVALTGAQVAASAGTVTPSQAITKALTGAQVAASAGTLTASQQVTKALTGEQVSALAGTVTPSQSTGNVDVALTGAQVAASAGSVIASQQVSKTLTGAQVAAQAGTLTSAQTLSRTLTGTQVAASAGSVTASQQVSKALTGVQVAAATGVLSSSQSLSRTLTSTQITAQSGVLATSQQVSKALTGAQVAAQAGTLTDSQASNEVTLPLTGAQVVASSGIVVSGQAVVRALTGEQVSAQVGDITASASSSNITLPLTGAQVSTGAGNVGVVVVQPVFLNIQLNGARVVAIGGRVGITASSQYPSPANVAAGVIYGPTGVEFTGTMVTNGYSRGRVVNG